MVEVAIKIQTQGEKLKARLGRVRVPARRPGIRVEPTNEDYRRVLKHIPSGVRFRAEGSVEWPDDQFTKRRLRDGSIRVAGNNKRSEGQPQEEPKQQRSK